MTTHPADARDQTGFREGYVTAQDGLRLYYRDYGPHDSGRATALCLAGIARNSRDFHSLALRLSVARRVMAFDYRGRGRSDYDRNWRHYEPRTYVEDARHLMAATNTHRIVAIGTSMGGLIALGLAVAAASSVRAIVMNDVGPEIQSEGFERIVTYIASFPPQATWDQAALEMRRVFPMLSITSDKGWLNFARASYRPGGDGMLHADWDPNIVKPLGNPEDTPVDLWALYRGIAGIPALAVRGGKSDVLSETTFRRMKTEKPDLVQVVIPESGHAPTLGEPEAVKAIDAFLAPL